MSEVSSETSAVKDQSAELQEYVYIGEGPVHRRIGSGKESQLRTYIKGDKISLTPKAAFQLRGNLETLGGLSIAAHKFDGLSHPHVERRKPTSPEERAAETLGASVASKKASLTGTPSRKGSLAGVPD